MTLALSVRPERFALASPFTNSQRVETDLVVVVVELFDGLYRGRGECTPSRKQGESVDRVIQDITSLSSAITSGLKGSVLQTMLPPGAARNALDCALWDLEAEQKRVPAYVLANLTRPVPTVTAYTISFGSPEAMANEVRAVSDRPVLKLKLGGPEDLARIRLARVNAPNSVLIVDVN
jgi:L-Ala-D/L-Glu epimerase